MMSQQNPLLLTLSCWMGIFNYEKCNPRLKWKMLNSQWSVSRAACIASSKHQRYNELWGKIQLKGCMRKPPAVEGTVLTAQCSLWEQISCCCGFWISITCLTANALHPPAQEPGAAHGAHKFWQYKTLQAKSPASLILQNQNQKTFYPWISNQLFSKPLL